jgi:DNA-directed RNA polymerase subunit RPC12/RpoP
MKILNCPKHGEWVPDNTLIGCPECAAEALLKERRERDAKGK